MWDMKSYFCLVERFAGLGGALQSVLENPKGWRRLTASTRSVSISAAESLNAAAWIVVGSQALSPSAEGLLDPIIFLTEDFQGATIANGNTQSLSADSVTEQKGHS